MSRSGKEFSSNDIDFLYRKYDYKCDICGSQEKLEAHHILPIWVANEYFPSLAAWVIKSVANGRLVCEKCHDKIDHTNDWDTFNGQALVLLNMMGRDFF